jgi:hypothetical protein
VIFYCRSNNSVGMDEKLINVSGMNILISLQLKYLNTSSDFIQFDSIIIDETTTIPLNTHDISPSRKQKTCKFSSSLISSIIILLIFSKTKSCSISSNHNNNFLNNRPDQILIEQFHIFKITLSFVLYNIFFF